ncbi:hypothetical protein CBOM_06150 [Ceraceosorus bombacis]|uniref:Uncharacterized protein n=1 Tax=Ceraceosorus bombacis TaxID=401625 RepID=A0A0P1BJA6_9BASI|nr:hypothetical protein CBOM_06150 [Ceraceosorus bombacis]
MSGQRSLTKGKKHLPDPVGQYVGLLALYSRKSTDDPNESKRAEGESTNGSSGKGKWRAMLGRDASESEDAGNKKPVPKIHADVARVYFPGQAVTAQVEIDERALAQDSDLEQLTIELKGEVHSYGYSWDQYGNRYTNPHTETIFVRRAVLYAREGAKTDAVEEHLLTTGKAKVDHSDIAAWDVSSILPTTFETKPGSAKSQTLALPATFKDTTNSYIDGTATVVYGWKAVAKRSGTFKRHSRAWLPLLVSGISERKGEIPSLEELPANLSAVPPGWVRGTASQAIRKKLLFSKGTVDAELFVPILDAVAPDSVLPVVLKLTASAKNASDLTGPDASLPSLPGTNALPSSGSGGAPPADKLLPRIKIRRRIENSTNSKANDFFLVTNFEHSFSARVAWSNTHLQGPAGSLAHGWTEPSKASALSSGYSTTAQLVGQIHLDLTPNLELPTLKVRYTLVLKVPIPGLGSSLVAKLEDLRIAPSSGVTAEDLAAHGNDVDHLTRAVAGRRQALLLIAKDQFVKAPKDDDQAMDQLMADQKKRGEDELPSYDDSGATGKAPPSEKA